MLKIASPQELQAELRALMAFIHGHGPGGKPNRQAIVAKLNVLANRVAANYPNSLSWKLYLGGDPRNYDTQRPGSDAPDWGTGLKQITRNLEGVKTRMRGAVDTVATRGTTLTVYFEYPEGVDEEAALNDAKSALEKAVRDMAKYDHWAYILHGSLDKHSNLEIKDEAIESWS